MNHYRCEHLVLAVWLAAAALPISESPAQAEPAKHALLVGCTEYKHHPGLRELYGPANDVSMWTHLLTDSKGFAFPKENVTQLVGWPKEPEKRPTYANIVKGFEGLIARAGPGSRVVIVLSGHGVQVPIPKTQTDPLDPKNPEPDGLDEVFLPADVKDWTEKSGLENAILDDQVGVWLDKLRDKGAHVLIVFDCCHSGTMTRGGPGVREISRVASPTALGIKDDTVRDTVARAKKAVEAARAAGKPIPGEETVKMRGKPGQGSLVAFYGAQPFEEAPELPFPEGAPILRENYYGMLSWTLVQTMKSRQSTLTYGELQRLVAGGYRSSRGTRPPTPFAEGDLNREVLGMNVWPNRPTIFLEKDRKGKLRVAAGRLQGVTPGSILSVLPPPGDRRDPKTVLGHLKVSSVTPSTASVVPVKRVEKKEGIDWEDAPADARQIPNSARCEIVVRDFGDMRVKLFTTADGVRKALDTMHPQVKERVRLVAGEPDADWLLRVVTPEEAKKEYGISGLGEDHVFLVHGDGKARLPDEKPAPATRSPVRKVFGQYFLANEKALIGALERDLPKIFKWQNLWSVSGKVNVADGGETHGLVLEVLKLKDEDDTKGELLRDGMIQHGQELLWRARNEGPQPLWVTAFYLDANLGITIVYSGGVGAGKPLRLAQTTANTKGGSVGLEGLVVFAVPQNTVTEQPGFRMLEQEPLKVAEAMARGAKKIPASPFESLLNQAAFGQGTRGADIRVRSTPAILSQSWVLIE